MIADVGMLVKETDVSYTAGCHVTAEWFGVTIPGVFIILHNEPSQFHPGYRWVTGKRISEQQETASPEALGRASDEAEGAQEGPSEGNDG